MDTLITRLEQAVSKLEKMSSGSGNVSSDRGIDIASSNISDPSVAQHDDLVDNSFGKLLGAANKIGGQVLESSLLLKDAFDFQRDFILKTKSCKKPEVENLSKMLQPLNDIIMKATSLTEGKRSAHFNHLKTIAESLSAFAWVAYTGKDCGLSLPAGHVEESWQTAEFYNNKVLVEFKGKDTNHVNWAKSLKEVYIPGLRDYVRKNFPQGPVWNSSGSEASVAAPKPATTTTTSRSSAPPPPPPPSFDSIEEKPKKGLNAVFQQINKGESVTSGLRKVTDDMKTKNRADKSGVVPIDSAKEKRTTATSFSKSGPPRLELQMGRRWIVENQIGKKSLTISDCESKQSVYIYNCKDSVVQIRGKVNNICMDKCTKTGVVFTDVVSTCEIVNCNSVEVQCQGIAPSISIDTTSGCQLYLSSGSLGASITTSKSSEVNVMVPGEVDMVEHPLPEQFIHTFKDGKFVTLPVSHSGN